MKNFREVWKENFLENLNFKSNLISDFENLNDEHIDILRDITNILYKKIIWDRTHEITIEKNLYRKITKENLENIILENTKNIRTGDLITFTNKDDSYSSKEFKVLLAQCEPFLKDNFVSITIRPFSWV